MIKKLTRHGNSLALVIDRGILDLLNISEKTPLSITTDGNSMVISPAREAGRKKRLEKISEEIHGRYAAAFKRLAD